MLLRLLRAGQLINIFVIIAILSMAFYYQLAFRELPCALCLLQRMGFIGIGLGYVLNLRYGFYASHYAISFLSILFVLISSHLQILLHIIPGDPGYGDTFWGLHFYTWSYITGLYFIFSTAIFLLTVNLKKLNLKTSYLV